MATRKKAPKAGPEVKTVEYMAPGVAPEVTRDPVTIDPELEEIRDREAEANKVDISGSREEPSISPELVEARDKQIARESGSPSTATSTDSGTKAPAKKAAAKKSSK